MKDISRMTIEQIDHSFIRWNTVGKTFKLPGKHVDDVDAPPSRKNATTFFYRGSIDVRKGEERATNKSNLFSNFIRHA